MARFDVVSRWYDLLPVPTHSDAIAEALDGVDGPVVDLGGGTGRFTARFTPEGADAVVVDLSRGMLRQARARRPHLHLVQGAATRLPLRDGSAGAVVATEAFHHFGDDQEAVLADAARVLRDGGVLVVEEVDPDQWRGRLMQAGEALMRYGSVFRTPEDLSRVVGARFSDVATRPTSASTYLLTAVHRRS